MKTETSSLCLCVALTALHHNKQNSNNDGQSRYDSEMGYEKNWTSYGRIHFLKQLLNIGYQSLLRYIPNLTSSTPYRVLPTHKPTQFDAVSQTAQFDVVYSLSSSALNFIHPSVSLRDGGRKCACTTMCDLIFV
jgi:hypothetical protein